MDFFFIGLGGFLGANVRYFLANSVTKWLSTAFGIGLPYGTVFVNVTGSFLLAFFLAWAERRFSLSPHINLLIGVGFFGAYTTFSTYATESIRLLQENRWLEGIGYIALTNLFCLAGVVMGIMAFRMLMPKP